MTEFKRAQADGISRVELDLSHTRDVYANGLVSSAAIIQHYVSNGLVIVGNPMSGFVRDTRVTAPLRATKENFTRAQQYWNVVWTFSNSNDAYTLTSAVIENLERRIEFERGVLLALRWALYEVLDNVLEHSRVRRGYFSMQHLRASKRLAFSIADAGLGIHRSFYEGNAGLRPATASEAIVLAITQNTSSTGDKRGNGLYGLAEIVRQNGGLLHIRSGRGILELDTEGSRLYAAEGLDSLVIDADHHCTLVDFQLHVDHPISLTKIFPYEYDARLESLETDDGEYRFEVSTVMDEVATRDGGQRVRTAVSNLLKDGAFPLYIDFSDTGVVSASFLDEFLGKLAQQLGQELFDASIRVRGLSDENKSQLQRILSRRLSG